ncbi:phage baseplate assembly protein V [Escherichia coli]|nr:phage baseplate assembly protein V [Escherichia coli]
MNAEIMRLLENMIRVGVISDVDLKNWRVRVTSGGLTTDWLRWNCSRAGVFKIWFPPSRGEQVLLLCPGGNPETAMVVGSLYSTDNPAPGTQQDEIIITAPDGASFRYNARESALDVTGIKTAKVTAETRITLETPLVECTQHLKTRTFELTDGGTLKGDVTHSGGSLTSNGVVTHTHTHTGVQSGGSQTGGPQ